MAVDFRASAAVRHPGDKGAARENVLRRFLCEEGYLPARYRVSDASSHVVSTTGHISAQVDLLVYDALTAPRLLSVGGICYYPIESCYGLVECKSDLSSRDAVVDGLEKVAAFKRLRVRTGETLQNSAAFGVLFAYTASLKWETLFETIQFWQKKRPRDEWPNVIVVIDQGVLGHTAGRSLLLHNHEIRAAKDSALMPLADSKNALLCFYLFLLDLLGATSLQPPPLRYYVALPITSGSHSYRFEFGAVHEAGFCEKHGRFLYRLDEQSIVRVQEICPAGSEVDGGAALNAAYGEAGGMPGFWGRPCIYNPDELPYELILTRPARLQHDGRSIETRSLDYVSLIIEERQYWLPRYYVLRDGLLSGCPKCGPSAVAELTPELWRELLDASAGGADGEQIPAAQDEDSVIPEPPPSEME